MSEIRLDWATAEVDAGKLTVELDGEGPEDWRETFERSVKLLHGGRGDWDEVALEKQTVSVSGLRPGEEDKLRHFLEGVMLQVNARGDEEESEPERGTGKPDDSPDGQMTARFQSFAAEPERAREDGEGTSDP